MNRLLATAILVALALLPTGLALAHDGVPLAPHDLWQAWTFEPLTVLSLTFMASVYASGVTTLWRRAGLGRGVTGRRAAAFIAGWLTLVAALVSPLDALSGVLFSAHMVQHLLLMVVAPPLLVYGMPPFVAAWAVPGARRRLLAGWWRDQFWLREKWLWASAPGAVWALHGGALWLWHTPRLYEWALRNDAVHYLEHACFFGTATLFWWTLIRRSGRSRLSYGAAVLFVFTTMLHSGLLGALITFAPQQLYPHYSTTSAWGLTFLQDQQLAGIIMWFPVGVIYLAVVLTLVGVWFQSADRQEAEMQYRIEQAT